MKLGATVIIVSIFVLVLVLPVESLYQQSEVLRKDELAQPIKLIDDGNCTWGEAPDVQRKTLFSEFSHYMWDILGPLERITGANPCPMTQTLKDVEDGLISVDKTVSRYDYVKSMLIDYAKGGIFNVIQERKDRSDDHGSPGMSRSIAAHLLISYLDIDYLFKEGLGCPLALGWRMKWKIRKKFSKSEEYLLQLNAVPVRLLPDGSYATVPKSLRPSWEALVISNRFFHKKNHFSARVETLKDKDSTTSFHYYYDVSNDTYECTERFVEEECLVYSDSSDKNICQDWGRRCGLSNVVKLDPTSIGKSVDATHLLYVPGRAYGRVRNAAGKESQTELKEHETLYKRSLRPFPRDSMAVARQMITSWQNTKTGYVPELVPEQDFLTFMLLFLTCLSEWVFSGLLWSWKRWRLLVEDIRRRRKTGAGEIVFGRRERRQRKLRIRALLLLPAIITYVPLVFGFVLSARREGANVSLAAGGYSFRLYRALTDSNPDFQDYLMGRTFGKTFLFQEESKYQSLGTEYLVALCIMTSLILFSMGALGIETHLIYNQQEIFVDHPPSQSAGTSEPNSLAMA